MGGFAQGSQQDVGGTGQPAGPQVVLLALLEGGHHIVLIWSSRPSPVTATAVLEC